jgi:hypothetical protein
MLQETCGQFGSTQQSEIIINDGQLHSLVQNCLHPNQGYPDSIKEKFGENLELVFGPKNKRVDYRNLSQKEIAERLEKIPEKLFVPQTRGGILSILDSWILALEVLAESKALWGVDLPPHSYMPMEGTERHPVENLWINYGSQRILYLRHCISIVFKFDPWSVFNAIGRKDNAGLIYINDGQHRTMACLFFGMRYMAIQYRISNDPTVDIDQFCACNVDNLPSEPYDNYRNRSSRAEQYIQAGKIPFREDQEMLDIKHWAKRWKINICRANDPSASSNRGISHMGDILKSARMGIGNMDIAAAVHIRCYGDQTIKSANLLGLTHLISQQDNTWTIPDLKLAFNRGSLTNPKLEDLSRVILKHFQTGSESLHATCKKAVNDYYGKGNGIGPEIKVGHALYHVYKSYGNKFSMTAPINKYDETIEIHSWLVE